MRFIALLLFAQICSSAMAQQKVSDSAFNLMLKTLLNHSVQEISVDSLAENRADFVLLDARSSEEFAVSHIKDAHFMGYENFPASPLDSLQRDKPLVVYCSVGYRSEKIAEKLSEMGFNQVYNLYGGIFEWVNRQHLVYSEQGETQRIHAYNRLWGMWLKRGKKVYH